MKINILISLTAVLFLVPKVFSQKPYANPGSPAGHGAQMNGGMGAAMTGGYGDPGRIIDAQRAAINQATADILYSDDASGVIKKLGEQYKMNMAISSEQRQSDLHFYGYDRYASVKNYWEALSYGLTSDFTVLKNSGGVKPESLEQLKKAIEYLAKNQGDAFKSSLKGLMKNYKDHPEWWEEMITTLQTEFTTGSSKDPSVALKIITDVAYDKAFEGLGSRTPKTFNDKECFKKMSETISKKFVTGQPDRE